MNPRAARCILTAIMVSGLAIATLPQPSFAQNNSLIGTWKINLDKSKYNSGTAPRSQTNVYQQDGQNIKGTARGVDWQGNPMEVTLLHTYDGQPHPTTGNTFYDSSTYTRVDANTIIFSRSKAGKLVVVGTIVMAPDGKSYTTTTTTTAGKGGIDISVGERQ